MNSVIHMLFAQEGRKITFLNPKLSIPWTHLGRKCVSGFLICPLLFGVNMWCLQYVYQYVSQDRLHCTTITHDPLKSKCLNWAGNMVTQKPRLVVLPASSDVTGSAWYLEFEVVRKDVMLTTVIARSPSSLFTEVVVMSREAEKSSRVSRQEKKSS